MNNLTQDN